MKTRAKATEKEKAYIREWLFEYIRIAKHRCPFIKCKRSYNCHRAGKLYCRKFFPTLKEWCPCEELNYKYVRKIAWRLVK